MYIEADPEAQRAYWARLNKDEAQEEKQTSPTSGQKLLFLSRVAGNQRGTPRSTCIWKVKAFGVAMRWM